ncbi:MAG: metallophosphoesterase family protein [Acidimicrobiales bacterium]
MALLGPPVVAAGRGWERRTLPPELTTVSDEEAVVFDGVAVHRAEDLEPGRHHSLAGITFRTLDRPPGARLATLATVNDAHFGEVECGRLAGVDLGPVLTSAEGAVPYPRVMNMAAAAEIAAISPDLVVAKGDLTSLGRPAEYQEFEDCYRTPFGSRLVVTRGNHDNRPAGPAFACDEVQEVRLPGVTVAVLDTSEAGRAGGRLRPGQLEWLDELGGRAGGPVLVFGHHPCWQDGGDWLDEAAALDRHSSARLVEVVARRDALVGYFAGHTHRFKVRRFPAAAAVPFAEVACTKDFPGAWAEYRIYEGGILQVAHRTSSPGALAWSERCRDLFGGLYPRYAFGELSDRCFRVL